ncbi:MAG: DNA polymerase I [Cyclobacteriaceae bacterium]|nr:MAG: DNA polymerase I [Cyclobacteriaceae bacterium]
MPETPKLFLLDAMALIYRAHFAFTKTPRINSKGINTSVPFGFTNTLLEVLQKQKPTHIGVAFDTSAPTFRDELFTAYKATRQETPEDIRYGLPKVKEILRGFNIPVLELDGYEADDIIGTLARQAEQQGFDVFMMTPDKDFGQLVTNKIKLYKPAYMGNAVDIMGPAEVCEKWDISHVDQVTDMLGLQGDTSDNIPGVPGIGPKTAAALIRRYGSIENILQHVDELKGKQKELLKQYGEQALLSKKLATIITNVPITFRADELKYTGPDESVLRPLFQELEFRSVASRLFADEKPQVTTRATQLSMFSSGTTEEKPLADLKTDAHTPAGTVVRPVQLEQVTNAQKLLAELSGKDHYAVEVMNGKDDEPVIFVATSPDKGYCFVPQSANDLQALAPFFTSPGIVKTGHNLKASMLNLKYAGVPVTDPLFDTLIAHYLIEPETAHDLQTLARHYLNRDFPENASEYEQAVQRISMALELKTALERELQERRQLSLLNEVELPLIEVLASMEYEGVNLDTEVLAALSDELKQASEKVQEEIFNLAGETFNINSPKQLGDILFEKLKLGNKPKKTKTGQYATGEDVLLKLIQEHPIIRKILDYREYEKLRSTYVDALPRLISPRDGRIHTDYRQAVAATGRLSSNNPNLQNIPIRTEKGRQIRKAFIPRSDEYLFMSADYSQIELRIAASFAHDETMIEAFKNKRDIHATTAARVFKVPLDQVTADMRRKAKEVNFGILYGSTAFGLAQNLNIPRSEASEIIEAYFREFPAIKKYIDRTIQQAREKEYVETILGRRRYLRDINSRNIATRGFAERNAINAPIQGSAADIIKIAMVRIHRWLTENNLKTRMILQVHDELVFDVHKTEVEQVKENVVHLMKTAAELEVPMEVEVGIGKNWLEAH